MSKTKFTFCLLLVFFFSGVSLAQERKLPQVDENYQKYLNDGRNTGADADVKLAVSSLVSGFLTLQYEQKITPSISVEAGGALQVLQGFDLVNAAFLDVWTDESDVFKSGFGYSGAIRYYSAESAITNLGYASLVFRNRTSNFEESKMVINDIYYSTGIKTLFMNSFSADISSGLGARVYSYDHDEDFYDNNMVGMFFGFEVKLGYYIKYN